MAFDGLGGGTPTSSAILEQLESNNMMYDFGTGVEELAHTAQNFGYKGSRPFHNWSLSDLQDELNEGRAPVVAIGTNGEGQPGHFVTVTGISPDGEWVSYNDPTLGEQTITAEEFNRLWGLQGNSGVAVRKTVPAGEENIVPWVAFAATLMAIISQTPLALKRMGIGGRITIAGGATTRRRSIRPRAPRHAARRIRPRPPARPKPLTRPMPPRRFRSHSRPTTITPQPDPSPQMFNTATPRMQWKEKLYEYPPQPEPPEEDKSLLDRIADQISNPEFTFDFLTSKEVSSWMRALEDIPSFPIALPWLQGFGPSIQKELIGDENLLRVIDDWAGPIVRQIDPNIGVRTIGRTIGDASFAPLFGFGWGLSFGWLVSEVHL
jgi:hypothetical protein